MTLDKVISYNHLFVGMETKSRDFEVAEYYRDTAKCLEELKELRERILEYKRLLKVAVEDFNEIKPYLSEPYSRLFDKWRYADEALMLIES